MQLSSLVDDKFRVDLTYFTKSSEISLNIFRTLVFCHCTLKYTKTAET